MTTTHNKLFDKLPAAALLVRSDGEIIGFNKKAGDLLPFLQSSHKNTRYLSDFIDEKETIDLLFQLSQLDETDHSFQLTLQHGLDLPRHFSVNGSRADQDQFILLFTEIEQKTSQSYAKEHLIIENQYAHSPAGILIVDQHMEMLSYNRNFLRMWGIPEYIQQQKDDNKSIDYVLDLVENPDQFLHDIHTLYNERNLSQTDEIHLKDGRVFYRHTYPLRHQKTYLGRVWYFLDISELHDTKERLNFIAHHDPLTELPNRRLFHDLLQQNLAHAQRNRKQVAILFLDLDNFKSINDHFGHQEGDLFLKELSQILIGALRESDIICRWGGDEFVIALMDTEGIDNAEVVADKIRQNVVSYGEQNYPGFSLGTSIGISLS